MSDTLADPTNAPPALRDLLPAYLGRQRWFAGSEPSAVDIVSEEKLGDRVLWVLVDADGARYSLFVSSVPATNLPEFLNGHENDVIGVSGDELLFDAVVDGEAAKAVLALLLPDEEVSFVRPMGAEQSNTSLVFDDRLVLKLFRRLHAGANPDVEVARALAGVGFPHVAAPLATWERDGFDLAVVQPYLAGATEGWSLALTSLRDFYATGCEDPRDCGGDLGAESRRLGEVTANMHLALAASFGTHPAEVDAWTAGMVRQLDRVGAGRTWQEPARAVFARLAVGEAGCAIRVHGDYHLGQVVRTDGGWFVLDFEGEPARPLHERTLPTSPLKDVAGMLRSFDYAVAVCAREWPEDQRDARQQEGARWLERNRFAFLEGYFSTEGIAALVPSPDPALAGALAAWELDKAIYEVDYERAHRPEWVGIPEAAIARLLGG